MQRKKKARSQNCVSCQIGKTCETASRAPEGPKHSPLKHRLIKFFWTHQLVKKKVTCLTRYPAGELLN